MNGLLPAFSVTAALLAGVIAVELTIGDPTPPVARPRNGESTAIPAAKPGEPLPDAVAALLARPPFAPTRRPDAVAGSDDPRLPHLTGILVTTQERRAIFAGQGGARGTVVGPGDQVGGYRVQAISATDVTLTGADGAHIVRPSFSAAPVPSPLSVLAPVPGALSLPQVPPPAAVALGGAGGIVPAQTPPIGSGAGSLR